MFSSKQIIFFEKKVFWEILKIVNSTDFVNLVGNFVKFSISQFKNKKPCTRDANQGLHCKESDENRG